MSSTVVSFYAVASKVRSKFDDHSDVESPGRQSNRSHSEDDYMPESPEMSDVEIEPEDELPIYYPAIQVNQRGFCHCYLEFPFLNLFAKFFFLFSQRVLFDLA